MTFVQVAKVSEIEDLPKKFEISGKRIMLHKVDDEIVALEALCTHARGPLWEGRREENVIICPLHGAHFDLKTGKALTLPATRALVKYNVKVENDLVFVDLQ